MSLGRKAICRGCMGGLLNLRALSASDHKINDFPGYEHPGWLGKQEAAAETRKLLSGTKVIALYPSLFLEFATTVSVHFACKLLGLKH